MGKPLSTKLRTTDKAFPPSPQAQAEVLGKICAGALLSSEDLNAGGTLDLPDKPHKTKDELAGGLFDGDDHIES